MPLLKDHQDALGHELHDYFNQGSAYEIIERDDGLFALSPGPDLYFSEYDRWLESDKQAMKYVSGRVLDVGCGAGRHSLYLQERGHDVVGIDVSPLAVQVCKARGLQNVRVLPVTQLSTALGTFDTILMLGGNFGLFGSPGRARWLLRRFRSITSPSARIIAQTRDPYDTSLREHLDYHEANRARGRPGGQTRIRVRYKKYVTPWFDFLLVSRDEMKEIVRETGWEIKKFLGEQGPAYVAIIEKHLNHREDK